MSSAPFCAWHGPHSLEKGCPICAAYASPQHPNVVVYDGAEIRPHTSKTAPDDRVVRAFETGATRSADVGRYDPEGYLSPIVIERFCQYMQKHQFQADGTRRPSDNWQKGMPLDTYIKGLSRHYLHLWTRHRGFPVRDPGAAADIEEDLCALMFNVQGYLFEILKAKISKE